MYSSEVRLFHDCLCRVQWRRSATAGAEQVAEGCDNDDDRETEPYSAEGRGANVRDTGNIDTVDDIVEKTHDLGYKHRQSGFQNVADDIAISKSMRFINNHSLFTNFS